MLPFGRPPSPYVGDIIHGRPLLCLLIGIYILKYLKMYHKRQKYITQINYILLTFFYPAKKPLQSLKSVDIFFKFWHELSPILNNQELKMNMRIVTLLKCFCFNLSIITQVWYTYHSSKEDFSPILETENQEMDL